MLPTDGGQPKGNWAMLLFLKQQLLSANTNSEKNLESFKTGSSQKRDHLCITYLVLSSIWS